MKTLESFLTKCRTLSLKEYRYNDLEFIDKLGAGASGEVWSCKCHGELYTSKEYYPYDDYEKMFKDIFWELYVGSLFANTEHIIQTCGFTNKGERIFILYKDAKCLCDLRCYIRKKCFWNDSIYCMSSELKKELCISLIKGVQCIHKKNFVHCDLKPENMIVGNHKIIIIDLGCVTALGENEELDGFDNWTLGTPGYMSKELTKKRIRYENDIYSIGVIMIDLWTKIQWGRSSSYIGCRRKVIQALKTIDDNLISSLASKCISEDYKKRPSLDFMLTTLESSSAH
jgi:serine/threonine protein kinase